MPRQVSQQLTQLEVRIAKELESFLASGYTTSHIAVKTGIQESTLSRYKAGITKLSLDNAGRLCKFLGLILGRPQPKNGK